MNLAQSNKLIKFFTSMYCPFAQMVQISFNEVGQSVLDNIEYVQGISQSETGETIHHPDLLALNYNKVPLIVYKNEVLKESKDLIRFIDKEFSVKPYSFIPEEEKLRNYSFEVEDQIRNKFISSFYQILFKADQQEKLEKIFLQTVFNIIQGYKGPYYLGEFFSSIDITMAPFFLRMHLLEKLCQFKIPETEEFAKWFNWKENLIKRKCVADSIVDENKILEIYNLYQKNQISKNQKN